MKHKNIQKLRTNRGMTLTEVLIAICILMLIIFTFTPLFAQYYRNIYKAGEINKATHEKVSIIEKILGNKGGHINTYETEPDDVPLVITESGTNKSLTFSSSNDNLKVTGYNVTSDYINSGTNQYVTFYTNTTSSGLHCFPSSLTDDFLETTIKVVAKGFKFHVSAGDKPKDIFEVYYTDSNGTKQEMSLEYWDVNNNLEENDTVAEFTFKGANNQVCFQHSPIVIYYGAYHCNIEIGAPEIILVGEKANDDNYYYYATSGVNENGEMDLIAKKMSVVPTGSQTEISDTQVNLRSAMNDVEWVAKGMGDDGNGGKNDYGYYIMGGDEGQVRRFWKSDSTGNYYWGGDNTTNYYRNLTINNNTVQSGSSETMTPTITGTSKTARQNANALRTNFVNIFKSNADKNYQPNHTSEDAQDDLEYGYCLNSLLVAQKGVLGYHYDVITTNYFTANVTVAQSASARITLDNVLKTRASLKNYQYYGPASGASDNENATLFSQFQGNNGSSLFNKLDVEGYIDATNYDYTGSTKSNANLITITSVGAINFGSNVSFVQDDTWNGVGTVNSNVYPTKSYTLYCGYIPAVMDVWGRKYDKTTFMHMATLGIALGKDGAWYPTGTFGDTTSTSSGLSSTIFNTTAWKGLLNYTDGKSSDRDTLYPYKYSSGLKSGGYTYVTNTTVNNKFHYGIALPAEGNDYYLTNGQQVDVTIGYLSQPYAIALNRVSAQLIGGTPTATDTFDAGSDYYFTKSDGKFGSGYDHSFFGSGQRDFITMLDVKSYHDDVQNANFSMAVGYSLGFLANDYSDYTRLGQVYNSGVVFLRATGDGSNNDTKDSLQTGKGWTLAQESNVFHQFYTTREYSDGVDHNGDGPKSTDTPAVRACLGWNTIYHRDYYNISKKDNQAPSLSNDSNPPGRTEGNGFNYGTNTHTLAQTECNCVNWGTTWDTKPQAMWGTENGTLMSWHYNYEATGSSDAKEISKQNYSLNNSTLSKSTTVVKEFESYTWADRFGSGWNNHKNEFYDYNSVNSGTQDKYGFISVLNSINDVAFGDDYWVAVGDQSGKDPASYCASKDCYSKTSGTGSYINVKYTPNLDGATSANPVWKAVKVSNATNVNFISVTYCEGTWYAMGYIDVNDNDECDANEKGVIYYAVDPRYASNESVNGWKQAKTRTNEDGDYTSVSMNNPTDTYALYYESDGTCTPIKLSGINSMASQG